MYPLKQLGGITTSYGRCSAVPETTKTPGYLFFLADVMSLALETAIYFASFALPALFLWSLREVHPLLILIGAIVLWWLAALIFVLVLVLIKRLLIGEVPYGRFFLTSPRSYRWMAADRVVKIMVRSPFQAWINENAFLRYLFYRGMGARITTTFLAGNGIKIPEPWAISVGENVVLGDEAILTGHKVERNTVTLDRIEIGNDVIIGARSMVFPGVTIGDGAMIGANSVVTRGTEIPAGEVWSGNPARKVDLFAGLLKPAAESGEATAQDHVA